MRWTVIRGDSLQRVAWRNGQGTSRAILTRLGRDGALLWQVGIADLVADAPFSHYLHCDRIFMPIAGPPVELAVDDQPFEPCPLLVPKRFAGEREVSCRVTAPGRALNTIADRRHHAIDLAVLRLEAGDAIEAPDAPEVVVYCLSGELAAVGDVLRPGDSLFGPGPASPGAAASDAVALLVAIAAADAAEP